MAKKKTKLEEPAAVEPDETEVDSQDSTADDHGLTYTKRYTVSLFNPSKSDVGHKCYDDFYETNVLKDAKAEAERVFKEENLEVAIWDREGMCTPPILYTPEEVKDDSATTEPEPTPRRRRSTKSAKKRVAESGAETSRPKPKHPRRKKS